ncbi:MAG: hypothetical protein ACI828_002633, partial [Flavobacteriales bacterium]
MKIHYENKITNTRIKDVVLSLLLIFSISLVFGYDNVDEAYDLDTVSDSASLDECYEEDVVENCFENDYNVVYGPMTAGEAGYVENET